MTSVVSVASPRLRLTQRGRVVFGTLATVLVAAVLAFVAAISAPHAQASDSYGVGDQQPVEFHYVIAQPGMTLWSLASELDPKSDPRDLIAEIVQLNQLSGSGVQAGEAIAVPLRYSEDSSVFSAEELGL